MSSTMTRSQMESRRMQAIELLREGWTQADVARKFDVTTGAVCRWNKTWKEQGKRALRGVPHPGRPSELSDTQRAELMELLDKGALDSGFSTDDWTCPRVQQLIAREFDVHYHVDHLSRLLRGLGYSSQRPKRRSNKHDPQAIKTWRRKDWKRIKKGG